MKLFSDKRYLLVLVIFLCLYLDFVLLTIVIPIFPSHLKKMGISGEEVGLLFSAKAILQIAANPVMGYITDKVGSKLPLMFSMAVLGVSTLTFAFGINHYWILLAARSVQGVASSGCMSAGMAYLALEFPYDKERGTVMGFVMSGIGIGVLTGPLLGSQLFALGGIQLPFFVVAGAVAFNVVLQVTYNVFYAGKPQRQKRQRTEQTSLLAGGYDSSDDYDEEEAAERPKEVPMKGILTLASDPFIILMVAAQVVANSVIAMLEPVVPMWLASEFGIKPSGTGLAWMALTIAYAFFNFIVGRFGHVIGRTTVMTIGMFGLGCIVPVLPLCTNIIQVVACLAGVGTFLSTVSVSTMPVLSLLVETRHSEKLFGSVYALSDVAVSLGFIFGPLLGTYLYETFNLWVVTLAFGGAAVLFAPFLMLMRWVNKDLEKHSKKKELQQQQRQTDTHNSMLIIQDGETHPRTTTATEQPSQKTKF